MRHSTKAPTLAERARFEALQEEWLPVVGYEARYLVSNFGRVKSIGSHGNCKGGVLKATVQRTRMGYLVLSIHGAGHRRQLYLHQIVCAAFHGPRPEGMDACHNDGDVTNNRSTNLRWDTPTANHADMKTHGTKRAGEKIPWHKLCAENVVEIRAGKESLSYYAKKFGVSVSTVHGARRGLTWKEVPWQT